MVGIIASTGWLGTKLIMEKAHDPKLYYLGVALCIVGGVFLCCICCCFGQMDQALKVIQEASLAILEVWSVVTMPFCSMISIVAITMVWIALMFLLYSTGSSELDPIDSAIISADTKYHFLYGTRADNQYTRFAFTKDTSTFVGPWMLLFWFFWMVKWVEYFSFLVVSMVVSDWYLEREVPDHSRKESECCCSCLSCLSGDCCDVLKGMWRSIRYHMGTIAFAAILIDFILMIQTVLAYIEHKIGEGSSLIACVFCCLQCCMGCIKCLVDRANKSTLVMTAVLGKPFCAGCGSVMEFMVSNFGYVVMGQSVIVNLMFFGMVICTFTTTALVGYVFFFKDSLNMPSALVPCLIALFVSYFLSKVLIGVWDTAATTLLMTNLVLEEWYPSATREKLFEKESSSEPLLSNKQMAT